MTASNGLFALIIILAVGFFAYNVQRLVAYLRIGRLDDSRWAHIPRRVGNFIEIGIFQKKIFRDSVAGPMHAAIFWGFCALTAGTVEFLAADVVPGFTAARYMPQWAYRFYMGNQDLWGAPVPGPRAPPNLRAPCRSSTGGCGAPSRCAKAAQARGRDGLSPPPSR